MAITAISRDSGLNVNVVRVTSSDNLATVAGSDYITDQIPNTTLINNGPWQWLVGDMVLVQASDGDNFFTFAGDDFSTLIVLPGGNGEVTLPVVANDFVVFNGTLGGLKDLGFSASDPAKSKVVMAGSAVVANHIAKFVDTAGTVDDTAGAAINSGDIQAGLSGTAGKLISYPATGSKGSLQLTGVANTGDTVTTISNAAMGQASVISIPDPAGATADFVIAPAALVSGNLLKASGTAGLVADSGAPATGLLQVASVAITAAQFNGMYAAPKLIIAAPGAGKLIVVSQIALSMTFVSAAYANGGVVAFQYDSTAHGAGAAATNSEAAADFFAAASSVFLFNGVAGNTVGALANSAAVNKGLYLSNLTGAFDTGDSTWVATVYYRILTV